MAKISTTVVNQELRNRVFDNLFAVEGFSGFPITLEYRRINDRQFGVLLTDLNGVQRYVRIGAIVAEEREDMTAEELMQKEIDEYNAKQTEKEEKMRARAEKAKKDKEERERKQKIIEAEKKIVESIRAKEKEKKEND